MKKKNIKINFITKNWILNLLKMLIRNGNFLKCKKIILKIILKILKKYENINNFFKKFDENIVIPLKFISKKIAGKKILIPNFVSKKKRIKYSIKIIFKALKKRVEKNLSDRLYNELIEIYLGENSGSMKNKNTLCKEILNSSINLRFLQ